MRYLKNCWYQAGWSEELTADAAAAETTAEVPLMFMRDDAGRPAALMDRCAHRFAPLSAGKVAGGRVTCGYHGLSFDASGRCVHNPHGALTSAMKVASFPVVERHSALWIWLGAPEL